MATTGFRSVISICIILCGLSHLCLGLYPDQAGLFDWKQDYIGKIKDFFWEQSSTSASITGKKLLVATEKNVIASLNAQDGNIVWRRVFEPGHRGRIDTLLHHSGVLISVHAGGQFVRSWQVTSGSLLWEKSLSPEVDGSATGFLAIKNDKGDQVIIATKTTLYCLRVNDGSTEWGGELPYSENVQKWLVYDHSDGYVALGIAPNQRITILPVSQSGAVKAHFNVPAPFINLDSSCVMMNGKNFVCYASGFLHLLSIDSSSVFVPTDLTALGVETSQVSQIESVIPEMGSTILFRSKSEELSLLSLTAQQTFSVTRSLKKTYTAHVAVHGDSLILLTLTRVDAEALKLTGTNLKDESELTDLATKIQYAHYHGNPVKMYPVFSKKKDARPACKLVFVGQDYSMHFSQKGKLSWRREEAMAYILAVQMVDLPVSENQAKFEDEFGTKEEDLLAMIVKRLKAQISQVHGLVLNLAQRLKGQHSHHAVLMDAIEEEEPEEQDLIRDDFNLHKIIVVATAAGKVYGIRSHTGKIAWQQFVPNLRPFKGQGSGKETLLVAVQRTSAHFPFEPMCTVVGMNEATGNGLLVSFNPVSGEMQRDHQGRGLDLGYKVVQADVFVDMNEEFLKGIMLLDSNFQPHMYPPSCVSVFDTSMQHFFYLTDPETNAMTGYRLQRGKSGGVAIERVWNLDLQRSQQTITGIYAKRAIEHVHSQGRVLGDRSVLYKYLNPNLVAVVTEGEEMATSSSGTKGPSSFFSIFLVDGVTGHIVYHQTHKRAKGPVKLVHSENWIVYSYFNEKYRRSEIGVLEMYEGKEQSNSTAFSSFSPPPSPMVMRQSYIFPEPLYAMEATVTEKGIASKSIIISFKIGGILSLPKALLDPRRPVIPTQETMEEGTIPYVPEIGLSTEALINYNRSMVNVDGVFTFPAGLESTALVFVYGIDVFYTRVMPSRMFDVLKEDFDYLFIGGVLGLMIVVSIVTQKLAAKKALNRAWK